MAHYTGKDLYISFNGVPANADHRDFSVDRNIDTAETTAGADTAKSYLTTLADASFKLTMLADDSSGTAFERACYEGASGTLLYGIQGTAAGKPKQSCLALVTKASRKSPYKDEVEFDIEFQKTGPWIADYLTSGTVFP